MQAHTMKLIPLWSSTGAENSLCDEVVPSLIDNTPLWNSELLVPDKAKMIGDKRLSTASGYYELVEVKANQFLYRKTNLPHKVESR